MRDYFLSGFTGDKALNANDKALLTIINNSIDEKVFQRLESKKGIDYDNEILTGDANFAVTGIRNNFTTGTVDPPDQTSAALRIV